MFKKVGEVHCNYELYTGDTVTIEYESLMGKEIIIKHKIDKKMEITSGSVYKFENEFGLAEGYAGVIGNYANE